MAWRNKRTTLLWVALSLAATVVLSVLFWPYGLFAFLFLPFGFSFGSRHKDDGAAAARPGPRTCPRCGARSDDPEARYCARDGSRLV